MVSGVKMATLLQPPMPIEWQKASEISVNWKRFKQAWSLYEIAAGIKEKPEDVRVATFLHVAGKDAQERYDGFLWKDDENKNNLNDIITKFDEDCLKTTNVLCERCTFLSRKQLPNESCDQFVTALRKLISSCNYDKPEEVLRDQFVLNIHSKKIQEKLFDKAQNSQLTFDLAVQLAKTQEATTETEVNNKSEIFAVINKSKNFKCKRCGRSHGKFKCPAYGKMCNKCGAQNHFESQCRSQRTQQVRSVAEATEYDKIVQETMEESI